MSHSRGSGRFFRLQYFPGMDAPFPGRTFETGTISNALHAAGVIAPHTKKPYSEVFLLGASGGIAFAYLVFRYKGWPAHLSLLARNTFHPFETVVDRLGIGQETKETVDRERALANLREALENGSPAVVWADIFSLAHTNLPSHPNIWAMMPTLVHAFDGKCFRVADRSKVSIAIPVDELMDVRARVKKDRFRMATLSVPDPKKLRAAVAAGIRQCIQLFDGVGAPKVTPQGSDSPDFRNGLKCLSTSATNKAGRECFRTAQACFRLSPAAPRSRESSSGS